MCESCWIDLEDQGAMALGVLALIDPECESEAWDFITTSVIPTVIVREDLDLAAEMVDEAVVMLNFLHQLSKL